MMQTFEVSSEVKKVGWNPADSALGNNSDRGGITGRSWTKTAAVPQVREEGSRGGDGVREVEVCRPGFCSAQGSSDMEMTALNNVSFCSVKFMDASKAIQRRLNQTANSISFSKKWELWNHDFINHKANALSSLRYNFIESNTNWFSSSDIEPVHSSPWQQLSRWLYGWGQISAAVSAFSPNQCLFFGERGGSHYKAGTGPCPRSAPQHPSVAQEMFNETQEAMIFRQQDWINRGCSFKSDNTPSRLAYNEIKRRFPFKRGLNMF